MGGMQTIAQRWSCNLPQRDPRAPSLGETAAQNPSWQMGSCICQQHLAVYFCCLSLKTTTLSIFPSSSLCLLPPPSTHSRALRLLARSPALHCSARALSSLISNIASSGAPPNSLGRPFHSPADPICGKYILTFNLHFPCLIIWQPNQWSAVGVSAANTNSLVVQAGSHEIWAPSPVA